MEADQWATAAESAARTVNDAGGGVDRADAEVSRRPVPDVSRLEEQVTGGHLGDPDQFLVELCGVRHDLSAIETMATSSREVYGRMVRLGVLGAEGALSSTISRIGFTGSPR